LRLWHEDAALTCEVSDDGPGVPTRYLEDHGRPPPTVLHGRGLWLARHLCDLVSIVADRHGTTVRMVIVLPLAT
jgi:anti-sigma regulatory factor (Ser/Thr protein kinase)